METTPTTDTNKSQPAPQKAGLTIPERIGDYKIIRELGEGTYARVYLANDHLDRDVALKILKKQYSYNDLFLEQFEKEAQMAAHLNHEHIITIFDRGNLEEGRFFISMEYAPEGTLRKFMQQQEKLTRQDIRNIVSQIAEALDFAHDNNIIHRDIKPSNILLGYNKKIKLADFGIAKAERTAGTTMGVSTTVRGTLAYMAPEQATPGQIIDRRSDVYALAIVVYEMLSDELPFDDGGGDLTTLIQNKRKGKLRQLDGVVPGYVFSVIEKALHPEAKYRTRSAGEFAKQLTQAIQQWERSTIENRDKQDLAGLAHLAMEQRKWREAKTHYENLLKIGPSDITKENLEKAKREIKLEDAWTIVSESFAKAEWDEAVAALNTILTIDSRNDDAPKKLEEARQQIKWQKLYDEGESAFEQEDYAVAVEKFTKIAEENPVYRDVQSRLEEFRRNQTKDELNRLREKTLFALAAGNLKSVNEYSKKILELAPRKELGVDSFLKRIEKLVKKITEDRNNIKTTEAGFKTTIKEKMEQIKIQSEEIASLQKSLSQTHTRVEQLEVETKSKQEKINSLRKELIDRLYEYLDDLQLTIETLNGNPLTKVATKDLRNTLKNRIVEIAARGERLENIE